MAVAVSAKAELCFNTDLTPSREGVAAAAFAHLAVTLGPRQTPTANERALFDIALTSSGTRLPTDT